jgi:hypothetical protein
MSVLLFALASMAAVADKPVKATYLVDKPVSEVRRCILLNSNRDTREVEDGSKVMIGFSATSRFYAVASLSPTDRGTTVELRGNGFTSEEESCLGKPHT